MPTHESLLLHSMRQQVAQSGETIIYHPNGGDARTIKAFVNRNPSGPNGLPFSQGPNITIQPVNSATDGISSSEYDSGLDQVTLHLRLGDTAQSRRISEMLKQDSGSMVLKVI